MKNIKNAIKLIIVLTFLFYLNMINIIAHPGNTDSNGCHTCRTNCSSWGLAYNEYHCHGGSSSKNESSVNAKPSSNTDNSIFSLWPIGIIFGGFYLYGSVAKSSKGGKK